MTFRDWIAESRKRVRENGIDGAVRSGQEFYVGALRRLGRWFDVGEPIYGREWDILVVLDACRYDLMAEVADEYDFVDAVERARSVGSSSAEWMENNFDDRFAGEMARTAHVTGNPYSDRYLDADEFRLLDEVWRYAWDETLGTIRARPITDRAIDAWRAESPDRLLVHYMQPHYPFVPRPDLDGGIDLHEFGEMDRKSFWHRVRDGDVDEDVAWEAYRENLRYVLEEVDFFLSTIDAERVVITADHGNAVGRLGLYGHPDGVPISELRDVPWIETSASREIDYAPEQPRETGRDDRIEERLEDLGYL